MKIVVTGGQGFIGSQLVRTLLQAGHSVLNLDKGTYAAHPANLLEVEDDRRYSRVTLDISDAPRVRQALQSYRADAVINCAAESHVDRSIRSASTFLMSNVVGVQVLLDLCRELHIAPFIQVSTDEVMGPTPPGRHFNEETPLNPTNPYSASKASAELMIRAAFRTHGYDARIVRSANNYGPRQYPEKLIPLIVLRALEDQALPLYGDGRQVRDWIHVEDHARAVLTVLEWGEPGGVYCVGARNECTNQQLVEAILRMLQKPASLIQHVPDRPGHDRRYAIDPARLEALGWQPRIAFDAGLWDTVRWYRTHTSWLDAVRVGAYQNFHSTWVRPEGRADRTGEHPAPRADRTGEHPAPRADRTGEHPAPHADRTGEHPAPRADRIGEHPAPRAGQNERGSARPDLKGEPPPARPGRNHER